MQMRCVCDRGREGGKVGKGGKGGEGGKGAPTSSPLQGTDHFSFFEVVKNWGTKVKNVAGKIMFF